MGIACDGGGESFVISAKIAKTITEIAKTHVAEVGVKIKEVVERTLEDVKEYFGEGKHKQHKGYTFREIFN